MDRKEVDHSDTCSDSWVNVGGSGYTSPQTLTRGYSTPPGLRIPNPLPEHMEKLLLDAAREGSRASSVAGGSVTPPPSRASLPSSDQAPSSTGSSPKGQHSPSMEPFVYSLKGQSPTSASAQFTLPQPLSTTEYTQDLLPLQHPTDWIWDWSSRPDILQPSGQAHGFRHPARRARSPSAESDKPERERKWPWWVAAATHAGTLLLGISIGVLLVWWKNSRGSDVADYPA